MSERESFVLKAEDCVRVGDKLIFIARDINLVFSLDMKTSEIQLLDSMPEGNLLSARLGAKIICWDNKLVFAPMKAEKIWLYDLDTSEWRGIARKRIDDGNLWSEMFQAVLYGEKLFIIGSNYPAIICLNLKTEELTYIEEPYAKLREKKQELLDCYFRCDYVNKDNLLYLASALENKVLQFNMENYEYKWIEVGSVENRYSGIAWDGENFWLAPRLNTAIVKWDGKDKVEEFALPQELQEEKAYFLGVLCKENRVIFPGGFAPRTMVFSTVQKDNMEVCQEQYLFYKIINEDLIVSQSVNGEITVCDKEGKKRYFDCTIPRTRLQKYFSSKQECVFESPEIAMKERTEVDVNVWCSLVMSTDGKKKIRQGNEYGEVIWKELRN